MRLDTKYVGSSGVTSSLDASKLGLATNALRPQGFFSGELLQTEAVREALTSLHGVVVSDLKRRPKDRLAWRTWLAEQDQKFLLNLKAKSSAAKQELAQSKYPHGFTAKTEIDNYGNDVEVIQAIGAELQKIGINLQISQVPEAQWSKDFSGGNLGAIAYTARRRLSRSRSAKPGWSSMARYIMGSPKIWVICSRSIRSRRAAGSNPRMT